MKVKIKETGEVVDVVKLKVRTDVRTSAGTSYIEAYVPLHKVELVSESSSSNIDWEQRKFELVKAATEGLLSNPYWMKIKKDIANKLANSLHEKASFLQKDIAEDVVEFASAVLTEYQKGGDE